jgi:hypothetical protein
VRWWLGAYPTEYQTEWVTHRIGEYPQARLALGLKPTGAKRKHCPLRRVDIVNADVKTQLLRVLRVWPA